MNSTEYPVSFLTRSMGLSSKRTSMYRQQMKLIQMILMLATGGVGLASGVMMAKVNAYFNKNCILYANLSIARIVDSGQDDAVIRKGSEWGEEVNCDLVTFEGVVVFINSFIWLWFYIHMESIKMVEPSMTSLVNHKEQRICEAGNAMFIFPPILINGILFFSSVVRAAFISNGYKVFLSNMCITHDDMCLKLPFTAAIIQRSRLVLLTTRQWRLPFAFHDAMNATIALSWMEPLGLAAYVLAVIVDAFLQANPLSLETDTLSDTFYCSSSASEPSESLCTPPIGSSNVDDMGHDGTRKLSGSVDVAMNPDRLPPVPPKILAKWLKETTPANTPESEVRQYTLNLKKKSTSSSRRPSRNSQKTSIISNIPFITRTGSSLFIHAKDEAVKETKSVEKPDSSKELGLVNSPTSHQRLCVPTPDSSQTMSTVTTEPSEARSNTEEANCMEMPTSHSLEDPPASSKSELSNPSSSSVQDLPPKMTDSSEAEMPGRISPKAEDNARQRKAREHCGENVASQEPPRQVQGSSSQIEGRKD